MRNPAMPKIDLAHAVASATTQAAIELTLDELVRAYSATNPDGNDVRLRKWVDAFGQHCAWEITSEMLELAAEAMLKHGYAPATANRDLSGLGSIYKWARARRLTPVGFKSPTVGVRRFAEPIRRVHVPNEDLERVLDAALGYPDRRFAVYVRLILETGARKSEVLRRRWGDVNLSSQEILAPQTKNGTPRVLFFSAETAQLMRRVFPESSRQDNALLFEGRVPGQPINYRRAWDWLCNAVQRQDLRQHDMRHVAAANLLRSGTTLGVAAQVLGHDPAVLARRYGHLETASLKKAQEASWAKAR